MGCATLGTVRAMQGLRGTTPSLPSHHRCAGGRGEGKHRNHVGTRAEVLGWGAIAGSPAQTRVPVRLGGVSRSLAPVLGLDPAKTSQQPLNACQQGHTPIGVWHAAAVTAGGIPFLACAARAGISKASSTPYRRPQPLERRLVYSLAAAIPRVRPPSMAMGVYRAGP